MNIKVKNEVHYARDGMLHTLCNENVPHHWGANHRIVIETEKATQEQVTCNKCLSMLGKEFQGEKMEKNYFIIETPEQECKVKQALVCHRKHYPFVPNDIEQYCEYSKRILREQGIEMDAAELAQCLVLYFGFQHCPKTHVEIIKMYRQINDD
jgi:hypothetical protein